MIQEINAPWLKSNEQIIEQLHVDIECGLTSEEVCKRQASNGLNQIKENNKKSIWMILFNQFKNLVVILLLIASLLAFLFGEYIEGVAIVAVILINATLGFFTELKSIRSVEALKKLGTISTKVRRDKEVIEVSSKELVPGDVVILEGGDMITADLRVFKGSKLEVNESILTGEALPVEKHSKALIDDAILSQRANILYKGTILTRGSGEAIVISTGSKTELGKISHLVMQTKDDITPLEKQLNKLGNWLIGLCIFIAVIVAITGILAGKEAYLMVEIAIALAVSAIPEGLPFVATIALARGIWRMTRHHALIKELMAVETLGATNIICTDKTGTLTENKLTLTTIILPDSLIKLDQSDKIEHHQAEISEILKIGILCNNASHENSGSTGDPLEIAILSTGRELNITRQKLIAQYPELHEEPFDPHTKMMATFHQESEQYLVAVKGAAESVLEYCNIVCKAHQLIPLTSTERSKWLNLIHQFSEQGLRILAIAKKHVQDINTPPYENLQLLGLMGFWDPPRQDVIQVLEKCNKAGIKVIMATGDHPATALSVARQVGLVNQKETLVIPGTEIQQAHNLSSQEKERIRNSSIFARVSPEQKLSLIELHQEVGSIVAMTGDGVNDAPALKKADIGISMGKNGTQVAIDASDMILQNDSFSSIVYAIRQGRIIFNNIRKFVLYLMSCNLSEILIVSIATLLQMPLPILPLQILFLNIVTDIFPSLALAAGESSPGIMNKAPPTRHHSIMKKEHWILVFIFGLNLAIAVLLAFSIALFWLKMSDQEAVTISFLTLAFAQLWNVFNMRSPGTSLIDNVVTHNPLIWGALLLCITIISGAISWSFLANILHLTPPLLKGWILIIGMSLLPLILGQLIIELSGKKFQY